ncbi:MAG: Plug domain-containing protein, partial [Acidobacteriota bacterium]
MVGKNITTEAQALAAFARRTCFALALALMTSSLDLPPAFAEVHSGDFELEPIHSAENSASAPEESQEKTADEDDEGDPEGDDEHASGQTGPSPAVSDTITVVGIRADDEVPITKTNLDRQQIERLSFGQDLPQLIEYTPSVTWYSDSGIGSNYAYFSLRGIQQTRINMTFDGAPLNDPAEHALYFNNFHDFSNAVDSIQIQRGVG